MRSTLSAAFTGSKMKIIFGLVSDAAKDFVDYHENQQSQVNEVEMKDAFSRFTQQAENIRMLLTINFSNQICD